MMIKKMTTLLITMLLSIPALCPVANTALLFKAKEINYYDPLIRAVCMVESMNGLYIWNEKEQAVGHFQIRQCRVDEYNKKLGTNYVLKDFYDYELSRQMFLYYAHGKNYEKASRGWNGGENAKKKWTDNYWNKVRRYL